MPGPRVPGGSGADPSTAIRKVEQARQKDRAEQAGPSRQVQQVKPRNEDRFRSSFQAGAPPSKGPELAPNPPPASTLLTENTRDGQVNCLDKAADWVDRTSPEIRARSELVFLKDKRAGEEGQSGHVVVRQGSKVYDPATNKSYDSTDAYLKEQPHYEQVGTLPAGQAKKILDTPPGSPARQTALERANVSPELQSMMVADAPQQSDGAGSGPEVNNQAEKPKLTAEEAEAAARADAQKVRQSMKDGCIYDVGAKTLQGLLEGNKDPHYQKALVQELGPELKKMAAQSLNTSPQLAKPQLSALAKAASIGGPNVTRMIATEMANACPAEKLFREQEPLFSALAQTIGGAELGAMVANTLDQQGKSGPAAQVGNSLASGIQKTREDFEEKKIAFDEANEDLTKFVAQLSPALTGKQRQKAILDYESRTPAYGEYEEAARKLLGSLTTPGTADPARATAPGSQLPKWMDFLGDEAEKTMAHLPDLANTKAGQELLLGEFQKQAEDQPSLFDDLDAAATFGKAGTDASTKLTAATTKAMGYLVLSKADDPEAVNRLIGTLEENHALFGCTQAEMKEMAAAFKALPTGGEAAQEKFKKLSATLAGGAPGIVQPIRALGFACSLVGAVNGVSNFHKNPLEEQVKAIGDTIGVGGDGASMLLQMFGKAGSAASKVFERMTGIGNAVGAIGDFIGSVQAVKNGDYLSAAGKSASALGGLILAAATIQAVPVGGQIAGGLLVAGGAVISVVTKAQEAEKKEANLKMSLQAAGITEPVLSTLVDADEESLKVLSEEMKLSPLDIQKLAQQSPELLTEPPQQLKQLMKLGEAYGIKGPALLGVMDAFKGLKNSPGEEFQHFVGILSLPGGPVTPRREEWDQYFDGLRESPNLKNKVEGLKRYLAEQSQPNKAA
ncbi:hypothetical protein [Corallococcus sp. CA041A]|uniref:hypothetical protein n=1 Tax=Corallococcus sp. CA041A TaxID=2316727 RepID=UPI0011C386F7|nr:hypothetical protein [Corallococcus sp. CA041A]